jgi:hypothetical protein
MDDYKISNLSEAKNEYCARLVNLLTPLIKEGFASIFQEAEKLCKDNREDDKYLMTFQNFLTRIPKWNTTIVETEVERIKERSRCSYLGDLLTCVHILQLKIMTSIRVGETPKKIDIDIPSLESFIHKAYGEVAKKLYTNVYLYDKFAAPLQRQQYNRETELIIKECLLNVIRASIPIESILRSYMDETEETNIEEEIIEEKIIVEPTETTETTEPTENKEDNKDTSLEENNEISLDDNNTTTEPNITIINTEETTDGNTKGVNSIANSIIMNEIQGDRKTIGFNDRDEAISAETKNTEIIEAPKTVERLEELSNQRNIQRRLEMEEDNEPKITIHSDPVNINVESINNQNVKPSNTIDLDFHTLA